VRALDGETFVMSGPPRATLRDDRGARDAAILDAVTKARRDADAYASAVGMRINGITGLSNACSADAISSFAELAERAMDSRRSEAAAYTVKTEAKACVEFAASPL